MRDGDRDRLIAQEQWEWGTERGRTKSGIGRDKVDKVDMEGGDLEFCGMFCGNSEFVINKWAHSMCEGEVIKVHLGCM